MLAREIDHLCTLRLALFDNERDYKLADYTAAKIQIAQWGGGSSEEPQTNDKPMLEDAMELSPLRG